jgi:hypothetical protein
MLESSGKNFAGRGREAVITERLTRTGSYRAAAVAVGNTVGFMNKLRT